MRTRKYVTVVFFDIMKFMACKQGTDLRQDGLAWQEAVDNEPPAGGPRRTQQHLGVAQAPSSTPFRA